MPTYEYACRKCGEHFELFQSFADKPLTRHRGGCGGAVTKVLAPVGVVLKGSGFYKTDSTDSARSRSKARASKKETAGATETAGAKGSDTSKGAEQSSSKAKESKGSKAPKESKASSGGSGPGRGSKGGSST